MTPTQEGLPSLATDAHEVEDLMRVILRAWKPCSTPQGHPHMEWAEIAARAVHRERAARLATAERQVKELRKELTFVGDMATYALKTDDDGTSAILATIRDTSRAALEAKSHDD